MELRLGVTEERTESRMAKGGEEEEGQAKGKGDRRNNINSRIHFYYYYIMIAIIIITIVIYLFLCFIQLSSGKEYSWVSVGTEGHTFGMVRYDQTTVVGVEWSGVSMRVTQQY